MTSDGEIVNAGTPTVKGAKVVAEVVGLRKGFHTCGVTKEFVGSQIPTGGVQLKVDAWLERIAPPSGATVALGRASPVR